jgi:hypothetical protein
MSSAQASLRSRVRSRWLTGLGLGALVAAFWLLRILRSGTDVGLLTSDVFLYYLPIYQTLYGTLQDGSLPLWNPYQLCGIPRLASLQAGFFYPGHILYLLLPVKLALGTASVLHLAFVAVTMAALVRRLGFAGGAAIAAALVLALRGRYAGMVFFPNMLEAAAWLPLGAIAVVGIVREGRARGAALLALCMGCSLLAGYPQVSVYTVYAWGALLAALLAAERHDMASWRRAIGLFALGICLGAALAAVQLLPGWELASEGTRSPGTLSRWAQFPFGWYGPGIREAFVRTLQAPFPLLTLSFGWLSLALLPVAFVAKGYRALAALCLGVSALVVLFAMGPVTPLFDWIASLPALGWFRFPRRSLFLVDFFLALVVAIGVHALLRSVSERFSSRLQGRPLTWLALLPGLLLAVEFFTAEPNRESLFFAPGSMDVYAREREIYTHIASSGERAWIRSVGIEATLPPKLATYFRMRSVGDYEPLNLRRQAEYFTYLMEGQLEPKRGGRPYSGRLKHLTAPTYPGALSARGHLLDVAAVHWLVVPKVGAMRGELRDVIESRGLTKQPVADPDFVLLRNPAAAPRAFVVYDVREAPQPLELMAAMSDPEFDPLAFSYSEGSSLRDADAPARGAPARIVVDEDTRVVIEADLEAPGMLVLADSFFPGWQASRGDEELEILPVNHLFRGVMLPAGRHKVRFEYRPWTVPLGAAISSLAALATLGLAFGIRRPGLPDRGHGDSIRNHDA